MRETEGESDAVQALAPESVSDSSSRKPAILAATTCTSAISHSVARRPVRFTTSMTACFDPARTNGTAISDDTSSGHTTALTSATPDGSLWIINARAVSVFTSTTGR